MDVCSARESLKMQIKFFFIIFYPEVKEQSAEEDAQTEVESTKQLTPVLQHSVSEESASSTASVGVEAKTR